MSRRLTDTRQGRAAPTLSLRLTEAMAAAVERVRAELVAASPAGLSVSSSDAARVLLGEALAARHAAASVVVAPRATPRPPRAAAVLHTAADGQLSLLSHTANDGAEALAGTVAVPPKPSETHRAPTQREGTAASTLSADEIRARLTASGATRREIADATGVSKTSVHTFLTGGGVRAPALAALAAYVARP